MVLGCSTLHRLCCTVLRHDAACFGTPLVRDERTGVVSVTAVVKLQIKYHRGIILCFNISNFPTKVCINYGFFSFPCVQRGRLRQDGAPAGAAVDLLHLSRPLPEPQAATMPALGVHGALHGGPRRLRPTTGRYWFSNHTGPH